MKKFIGLIVFLGGFFSQQVVADNCGSVTGGIIDCGSTKITDVYMNAGGAALIKISSQNEAPNGGWLEIEGGLTPAAKSMFASALIANVTQKNCWVRLVPTLTSHGFWSVDIIDLF